MMDDPKVSVIVPIYQCEQYLHRCVDSILSQTHRNLEIILVDDGSPDISGSICDAYARKDARIQVIHQKNAGVSSARNAGLDASTGAWLAFVDGDDWIEPDMVEYLLGLARKWDADLVQCGLDIENSAAEPYFSVIKNGVRSMSKDDWLHLDNSNGNKLYRREAVEQVRFQPGLAIGEDLDFNLSAVERSRVIVLSSEPKYHYVQHEESACHTRPTVERLLQYRSVVCNALTRCADCPLESDYLLYELLRYDLHIASQGVCYQLDGFEEVGAVVRAEIIKYRTFIGEHPYFTRKERVKFTVVSRLWPVYRILLPVWKRIGGYIRRSV